MMLMDFNLFELKIAMSAQQQTKDIADCRRRASQSRARAATSPMSCPSTRWPRPSACVVSLDGFEGPLDLLLSLARTQKVDLTKISILELAEQYLQFIAEARSLRLEIAADYLVTAAWLAFLKSKLLLPAEEKTDDGPSGEEMALHLAFRLKRLEAMREAVARLFDRKQLGVDFFARGMPEGIRTIRKSEYWASVYDLLKAYAEQRGRNAPFAPVKWAAARSGRSARRASGWNGCSAIPVNWSMLDSYLEDYLRDRRSQQDGARLAPSARRWN